MTAPNAGNTADSLRGTDRDVIANNGVIDVIIDEAAQELEIRAAAQAALEADPELLDQVIAETFFGDGDAESAEESGTEYVTREEFDVLLARINNFNTRSGHHI